MASNRDVKKLLTDVARNLRELAEIQATLAYNHQTITQEFARRIELLGEEELNGRISLDNLPGNAPTSRHTN